MRRRLSAVAVSRERSAMLRPRDCATCTGEGNSVEFQTPSLYRISHNPISRAKKTSLRRPPIFIILILPSPRDAFSEGAGDLMRDPGDIYIVHRARTGQPDRELRLHATGPRREQHHAVGQTDRLAHIMGHEHN